VPKSEINADDVLPVAKASGDRGGGVARCCRRSCNDVEKVLSSVIQHLDVLRRSPRLEIEVVSASRRELIEDGAFLELLLWFRVLAARMCVADCRKGGVVWVK
jgi:hypothetical protein